MVDKQKCEQYLEEKFDSTVWSFSRLNQFRLCPLTWYSTYVLGLRGENYFAFRGSLVHSIMEDFYNVGYAKNLPLKVIRETMQEKFRRGMRDAPPTQSWFKKGEWDIISSFDRFKPLHDFTAVEEKIEFEVGGFPFQGFIDLTISERTPLDWKSKWSSEKYLRQQYLYAIGLRYNGRKANHIWIVEYKNNMNLVDIKVVPPVMKDTEHWAVETVGMIRSALEKGEFPADNGDNFFCSMLCSNNSCEFKK